MAFKKKKSGKKPDKIAELRKIGKIPVVIAPEWRAGQVWRVAYARLPWISMWIKLASVVALCGALACLVIVFSRPRPVLLVSYPDGTTLCSMPPLDPSSGRPLPRPSAEAALCAELARRAGRGGDAQNLEFAKLTQVEQELPAVHPASATGGDEASSAPLPEAPASQAEPVSTGEP